MRYLIIGLVAVSVLLSAAAALGQTDEYRDLFLCRKAFADGFYEVAARACAAFIRQYPRSDRLTEVRLIAGRSQLAQNSLYEAAAVLESLLQDSGKEPLSQQGEIRYWLAEVYYQGRDFSRARMMYDRAARTAPQASWEPYAVYNSALCLYQEGNFVAAEAALAAVMERYPKHEVAAEAAYKIGEVFFERKDFAAAIDYLTTYVRKFPASQYSDRAYCLLAEALLHRGDRTAAINYYRRSLKAGPRSALAPYARYGIGWAHLQEGRYKEAIEAWEQFREFFPRHELAGTVVLRMSEAYQAAQEPHNALAILESVGDKPFPPAQRQELLLRKARLLVDAGRVEEAMAVCERLSEAASGELAAEEAALRAAIYRVRQDVDAALAQLQRAERLSNRPEFKVEMLSQMAELYTHKSDSSSAQAVYDVILKQFGETEQAEAAQYNLGVSLADQGRGEAAVLAFQHVIANARSTRLVEQAYVQLGVTYEKKGQPAEAVAELTRFIERYPGSEFRQEAMFGAATALFNSRRYEEAQGWYERVRDSGADPELRWRAQYATAWCLYHRGQESAAAAQFERCARENPGVPVETDIFMWLGHWHARTANEVRARQYFQRVVASEAPESMRAEAFFQIGRCWERSGNMRAAVDHFHELERRFPESDLVPLAMQKRAQLLVGLRKHTAARREFEQLAARFPDGPFPSIAWHHLALLAQEEHDSAAARSYLERALGHPATARQLLPRLRSDLARVWEECGELDQAIGEYLHVGYLHDDQPQAAGQAYWEAARLFERLHRFEDARVLYERIVREGLGAQEAAREKLQWMEKESTGSR